ncbi:MAG: DUF1829 domain-containing protein, partial [Chloroflexi bacterium]|nr:DUF1829 domain-containing protein [Chloroflexota bacterium]
NKIVTTLFGLEEIRELRDEEIEAYYFLNDQERKVGGDAIEALEAYNVTPALWSERDKHVSALAN